MKTLLLPHRRLIRAQVLSWLRENNIKFQYDWSYNYIALSNEDALLVMLKFNLELEIQ